MTCFFEGAMPGHPGILAQLPRLSMGVVDPATRAHYCKLALLVTFGCIMFLVDVIGRQIVFSFYRYTHTHTHTHARTHTHTHIHTQSKLFLLPSHFAALLPFHLRCVAIAAVSQ